MNKLKEDKDLKTDDDCRHMEVPCAECGGAIPNPKSPLNRAKTMAEEYLSGWKRAKADYQNLQKKMEKEREDWIKFASESLIEELLPVAENFEQAIAHVPKEHKDNDWVTGLVHIKKQLDDVFEKTGIEKIKSIGEKFDPNVHEAVVMEESDKGKEIILKEIRPGYKLHDKVLRPAQVIISR